MRSRAGIHAASASNVAPDLFQRWSDGTLFTDGYGFQGELSTPLDLSTTNLAMASDYRRLLTSWTGPLIQVTGGIDIGYNADGSLDTTLLTGTKYVTIRYDQTGNGRHQIGVGANGGYRICSGGVVDTLNGRPCGVQVSDDDAYYDTAAFTAYTGTNIAAIMTAKIITPPAGGSRLFSLWTSGNWDYDNSGRAVLLMVDTTTPTVGTYRNASLVTNVAYTANTLCGYSVRFDGANETVKTALANGSFASTAAWGFTRIGCGGSGGSAAVERFRAGSYIGMAAVWFGDPGATDIEAARAAAAAYWGGA